MLILNTIVHRDKKRKITNSFSCFCMFTTCFILEKASKEAETLTYAVSHVTGWAVSIIDVRHFDEE